MLEFNVKNQTISRVDRFDPATDSVDYLTAKFNFITADWDGKTKKALFRSGTVSYEAAINASGVCTVPWEVLVSPENKFSALSGCIKIFVSVVGTSGTIQIPTKECRVELGVSGLTESLNGAEPTPNLYEQFVDTIKADNDATVAEITADNDETRAEVEALKESAETAATSAEQSAASIKNDYCNALKGTASGEVVRVDDVSPVEHNAKAIVHGKNLFDISKLASTSRLTNNGDGSITVRHASNTVLILKELAPTLEVGKTYILSAETTGVDKYIYISQQKKNIDFNTPFVLTEEALNSAFNFYASYSVTKDVEATDTISNIQIEEGETATEYTPYIDPSTVTVTEETTGATYTPNADGTCDIVSVSPTMTLLTDTEGVTVDLEYNRDINKVIADLYNKLG